MAGMAQTFADALQRSEETRDPEPLVALFAEDATVGNLAHVETGTDGARRFWARYLDQFDQIRSTFSRLVDTEGQSFLVWTSEGSLKNGQPIAYSGVSIVDAKGDKVGHFETYYDSAAFVTREA